MVQFGIEFQLEITKNLLAKDVLNVHSTSPSSAGFMLFQSFLPVTIINVPLLTIRQHFISWFPHHRIHPKIKTDFFSPNKKTTNNRFSPNMEKTNQRYHYWFRQIACWPLHCQHFYQGDTSMQVSYKPVWYGHPTHLSELVEHHSSSSCSKD